jgi:DNA ligase-1
VHCGDAEQAGRVAVYSRNREDITESFPELEEAFGRVDAGTGLIFDGEILAWDVEAERALPFSVLGQRIGRKRVDDAMRRAIPVVFMSFDLLFAEGELLLPRPLRERRALLEQTVGSLEQISASPLEGESQGQLFSATAAREVGRLRISPAKMAESAEAIDQAYRDARARANEGVMIKAANSPYLPGRRGLAWLKLKRELATLDVVITGAEYGHGRRAGLLSDYTFAVRGPGGELLNVGKAYSGVTDAEIAELTEWLKAHTLEDFGYFRTVEPIRVLEVAFNNVMRSDRHSSGFALRFPRILRVRDDKPVAEIDTLERVEEVYHSQPDKGPDIAAEE